MLFVSVRHTKQLRWTTHLINEETAGLPRSWVVQRGWVWERTGSAF